MGKLFDSLKDFVSGSYSKNAKGNALKTQQESVVEGNMRKTLSMAQLQVFDWKNFGKTLLQNGLLPASYSAEPQNVDVYVGLDKLPRVQLTFASELQKQTQTLVIDKATVMVAVDGEGYVDNKAMSKVWQDMTGLEPEQEIGPVM